MKFIKVIFIVLLFSACDKTDEIQTSDTTTLQEAQNEQFLSFTIDKIFDNSDGREIVIKDFENTNCSYGVLINKEEIEYDIDKEVFIIREICVPLPENQVLNGHIENFTLEFGQIFPIDEVNIESNRIIDNEIFLENFIKIGDENINYSNMGFLQSYVFTSGYKDSYSIKINNIKEIYDKENMLFISGEFYGSLDWWDSNEPNDLVKISNGNFKLLIEN